MNRIYRSIWNATLGAWVAAPETARTGGGGGGASAGAVVGCGGVPAAGPLRWQQVAGAIALGWGLWVAAPAQAACSLPIGNIVSCTGATIGNQSSTLSNLTYNIQAGATIAPMLVGNPVVSLTGTGVTVNNNGQVDPALLAGISTLTTGLDLSNANGSTITVRNLSAGMLMGSSLSLPGMLNSTAGNALSIKNGAGGTSTVVNEGTIGASVMAGGVVELADIPVIAMYGGASNVLTNGGSNGGVVTGTITGRVAMQGVTAGAAGNTFINHSTVNGSVNLGTGGLSNSFYASTGSSVNQGSSTAPELATIMSLGLTYAATGYVDGGTLNNSEGGGNRLYLQSNPLNSAFSSGSIDGSKYLNFNNLEVTGGTWSLTKQLFSDRATTRNVLLTGGQLNVDSAALTGASITANGGALGAATAGAVVASGISLGTGGLTVNNSTNALTLNGKLTGSGALTKTGTGTLTLGAANDFTSATTLGGGTIKLGNAAGLSNRALNVTGASTLETTGAMTVANAIGLNGANLTVNNTDAVTLGGVISGTGALTKAATGGDLTLNNTNTFNGGVGIDGGKLILGSLGSISTANTITAGVGGTAALETSTARTLSNLVQLNGTLTLTGSSNLTLAGKISGTGGLSKAGTNTLTLSGANDFTGNSTLAGGTLVLTNNTALGSGQLTLTGDANMNVGGLSLANAIDLGTRNLTLNNETATTLSGALSGTGTLTKTGAGDLTLSGNSVNNFLLNSGKLILDSDNAQGLNGAISGMGGLTKAGAGTLTLAGSSSYTGNTAVNAGTLQVNGSLGSGTTVTVANGATVSGAGNIAGAVTLDNGGHLGLRTGSVLGLGSLTLNATSAVDAALGVANTTALADVSGNLTLDGTLNITDVGGFGLGVYRLFDYGGTLTDNGLTVGTLPTGVLAADLEVQTSVNHQVNLVVGGASNVRFWDGADPAKVGAASGGTGVWNSSLANWSTANGGFNQAWNESFAVFQGQAGTVTVQGTQRTTGMQFTSDGYHVVADASGTGGQLELVNNGSGYAAIRVDAGHTATLDVALSGSARLAKFDSGTLVLNGDNSYQGGTRLDGGTLEVGHNNALGTGAVQVSGASALQSNTAVTLDNAIALDADLTLAGSHDMTLTGAVSGGGELIQQGLSTVTLAGANTGTGRTSIQAGRLVASVANLASGAITNNAALELNQASDATLTQAISGTGSFTKTGAGTLTLAGANTSTGTTTISAGGLVASVASLASGAITNNAVLELNQASDASLLQAISGSGSLTKSGTGALTLSGDSSGYAGSTNVAAGSLLLASTGQLGGAVTVARGATLAGTGTVGSAGTTTTVQSGAVIAAGDAATPYGALHVAGNLTLEQGATYQVQADPTSASSSLIQVVGQARLGGSVLHVGPQNNASTDFQVGQTYTILQAGSIVGAFDAATSNYAYLDAALGYTSTDVTLKLQRNGVAFAALATSSNQAAVANAIEGLPSNHALVQATQSLTKDEAPEALSRYSGDTHANVDASLRGRSTYISSISQRHMLANLTAGMNPGAPVAQSDGPLPASAWPSSKALPAWAELVGHWQTYNGDGNAATLKQRTYGLFLGMDEEVGSSGWRLGGSLGYTNADGRVNARSSTSKVDSYSASVYGGKSFGTGTGPRTNVLGGLAYTWHDIETTRNLTSLGQTLKADYSAHTAQLFAEVGYAIGQYDQVGFEPFVGVSLGQQRTKGFQEKGGFAALSGQSSTDDLASTTLGLRMHSNFQLAGKDARVRATVGWRHAFGDVTAEKTMAFEGGQNFTVAGSPLARNTAVLGLEGEVALSRTAALVLGYRGELGSGQRDHAANVKLRWSF